MISTKIQRMLGMVLEEVAETHPDVELDLVVVLQEEESLEALVHLIEAYGGHLKKVRAANVHCRIPAKQVLCLAESDLVTILRLARLHHMH